MFCERRFQDSPSEIAEATPGFHIMRKRRASEITHGARNDTDLIAKR
jgi:hypothetical protein